MRFFNHALKTYLTVATTTVLVLSLGATSFGQAPKTSPEVKEKVIAEMNTVIARNAFVPYVDFNKWPEFLAKQKESIDKAENDDDFARAVNGALRQFGLSHIVLATPKAFTTRQTGKTVGIGITTSPSPDGILIVRVVKDAPADKVGLVPGDLIVEIDGKKAENTAPLSGPDGSKVKVRVKHANGKFDEYELTRREFSTRRKEELEWVTPDTAKLTVWSFDQGYDRNNVESLFQQFKKAKNLIIDLRFNGGGAVVNLQHLASFFLDEDTTLGWTIGRSELAAFSKFRPDKDKLEIVARSTGRPVRPDRFASRSAAPAIELYQGNVVVLQNRGSGSASEIFTAAMREVYGAQVVGSRSAGAVLFSLYRPLSNGYALQYPVMHYVTVRGAELEGNPIQPDFAVEEGRMRLPGEADKSVDSAMAIFERIRLRAERTKDGKG